LTPICIRSFVGWVYAPDPTGGAYSAPSDPIAVFWGLLLAGGKGKGRGEEEEEGRDKRGEREGVRPLP